MVRTISTNLDKISLEALPPSEPEGRVRMLFLSTVFLGFRRYHEKLIHYCCQDDDVDSVHIALETPLWQKVLGKSFPHWLTPGGWDFHTYRHLFLWRLVLNRWFRTALPLGRFDVVHVMTQGCAWSIVDRLPAGKTKFAVNIDCTAAKEVSELNYSGTARAPVRRAEQQIFNAADLIVCRNRWVSQSLREDYDIPWDKVHVARNSIFPAPRPAQHDDERHKQNRLVRLVFVGNDFVRKGGPELVRMHQEHFRDTCELHICSSRGVQDTSLKNVIWHGGVPNSRLMSEVLPSMDVFVMPTWNDMHPWAILEAASVGLPVVTSKLAGIPEMVIDGETGILCPVGDWARFTQATATLVKSPEMRRRMGTAAYRHVEANYNPDASFGGLVQRLKCLGRE